MHHLYEKFTYTHEFGMILEYIVLDIDAHGIVTAICLDDKRFSVFSEGGYEYSRSTFKGAMKVKHLIQKQKQIDLSEYLTGPGISEPEFDGFFNSYYEPETF